MRFGISLIASLVIPLLVPSAVASQLSIRLASRKPNLTVDDEHLRHEVELHMSSAALAGHRPLGDMVAAGGKHPVFQAMLQHQAVKLFWLKVAVSGAVVGGVFGMMGAGASMIMKPLLYYVFYQRPFKLTIFEMYLILIPLASLGVVRGHMRGLVSWRHVALVAICTSGVGTMAGANLAHLVSSHVQLVCFGFLVVFVAGHMWTQASRQQGLPLGSTSQEKGNAEDSREVESRGICHLAVSCLTACTVGLLSGFVGVGGGFMLTPLLCHMGHGMDSAVPTSLAVIALSAVAGTFWYIWLFDMSLAQVNCSLVVSLAGAGCLGLLFSDSLASLMPKHWRQKGFAGLLVIIGSSVDTLELMPVA